ncbi:MAG: hypothetical protein OEZ02_07405 [Anaerolineae bacterium]|nr:hypothetical protein [Anaerolineae bacterium]
MEKNNALLFTLFGFGLCGLPGLCILFFGSLVALGASITAEESVAPGLVIICLGLFLLLIPVGIAVYFFRPASRPQFDPEDLDDPLPPPI